MKFQVTFEIDPKGPFGVPQEGMAVIPGRVGELFGDTYHTDTGIRVGYGTMPEFRTEVDALHVTLILGEIEVRLSDNFIFAQIEAPSSTEAFDKTTKEIDKFLQNLSLSEGRLFTCKPLIIETEDRKVFPVPKFYSLGGITTYDLKSLKENIEDAQKYHCISEEKLDRALEYFEHALLLFQKRGEIADPLSRHHIQLIASVFLNLWKALSTIVGDPTRDSDYQNRYRKLGFDYEFFKLKIEKIRHLRNSYDVAHYSLTKGDIDQVERNFGEAQKVTAEVLRRYRDHLACQGDTQKDSD